MSRISKHTFFLTIAIIPMFLQVISAQTLYSFESKSVPEEWTSDNQSKLSISNFHFKDSENSLRWDWNDKSILTIKNFKNLKEHSVNAQSILLGWIYNAAPVNDSIKFVFYDDNGTERASFYYKINYKGWRFMWICYARDLGFSYNKVKQPLTSIGIQAPQSGNGSLYFDMFESRPTSSVNWHRSSDKQYSVGEPNASARNRSYDYEYPSDKINTNDDIEVTKLKAKLYQWFVGDDANYTGNSIYQARLMAVEKSIADKKTARWAIIKKLRFRETNDGVATTVVADTLDAKSKNYIGVGLHGDMSGYGYMASDLNNGFLFDMGLSIARYKGNDAKLKQRMLDSLIRVMDWMYDQGYAEGSGLGTGLTQLRCAGFPFAFFFVHELIKDEDRYNRYMNAIRWIVRDAYDTAKPGSSADDIRGAMLAKLVYALCIKDPKKRLAEMQYVKGFVENSLTIAPGYYGLIKPDYSVYHHLMPYYSEYGDDAIHQAAIVLYLLHDTKFALSSTTYNNIKNAVLSLTDVSCNYVVPAGVSGRFPNNGRNIAEHLPALAYIGLSTPASSVKDIALEKAFVRLYRKAKNLPAVVGMDKTGMAIQYSQSLGAAIALIKYDALVPASQNGEYSLTKFLPFSGLYVSKYNDWSLSVKGCSKYIRDFECITNEGRYSRYVSYGNTQIMSEAKGVNNYTCDEGFDYVHYAGCTSINWPLSKIDTRGKGNNAKERNYGDETFLGGVALNDTIGMMSLQLHDNTFNPSFRAKKTVFSFGNLVYFMGSDIENNDAINETHTTVLQNIAQQQLSLNGTTIEGAKDVTLSANTNIIKNSWNNTYIIYPQEGSQLHIETRLQNNPSPTGKMPAKATPYEVAWINHGTNPSGKKYNYALLLNEDVAMEEKLTNLSNPFFKILQQDATAHILQTNFNGKEWYGYALFKPTTLAINKGIINSVNAPCIIMVASTASTVELAFTNPDLNRPAASSNTENTPCKPLFTEVVLSGKYNVVSTPSGIIVSASEKGNTILRIESKNGSTSKIALKK